MNQNNPENSIKQNHNHECACGCSAAYDNIDDQQFEKAFVLNILPKKLIIITAVILIALTAALYFLL